MLKNPLFDQIVCKSEFWVMICNIVPVTKLTNTSIGRCHDWVVHSIRLQDVLEKKNDLSSQVKPVQERCPEKVEAASTMLTTPPTAGQLVCKNVAANTICLRREKGKRVLYFFLKLI